MATLTDGAGRTVRLSGTAEFIDEHRGGVWPFSLQLRDAESGIVLSGFDLRPGAGTYDVARPHDDGESLSARVGFSRARPPERRVWSYTANSGVLQVDAATEERLAGAFAFEARGWGQPVGLGPVVYVEGWFDATDGYNAR